MEAQAGNGTRSAQYDNLTKNIASFAAHLGSSRKICQEGFLQIIESLVLLDQRLGNHESTLEKEKQIAEGMVHVNEKLGKHESMLSQMQDLYQEHYRLHKMNIFQFSSICKSIVSLQREHCDPNIIAIAKGDSFPS